MAKYSRLKGVVHDICDSCVSIANYSVEYDTYFFQFLIEVSAKDNISEAKLDILSGKFTPDNFSSESTNRFSQKFQKFLFDQFKEFDIPIEECSAASIRVVFNDIEPEKRSKWVKLHRKVRFYTTIQLTNGKEYSKDMGASSIA